MYKTQDIGDNYAAFVADDTVTIDHNAPAELEGYDGKAFERTLDITSIPCLFLLVVFLFLK